MLSVGTSIGPFVETILYNLVGYLFMFMIIGLLYLLLFPFIKLTMPVEFNQESGDTTDFAHSHSSDVENDIEEVSYWGRF